MKTTTATERGTRRDPDTLPLPLAIREALPVSPAGHSNIHRTRKAIRSILLGDDPRLLVLVGPCSIHDVYAAVEYGDWLRGQQELFDEQLLLVMRAYVEKPRTRFGWGGLINDPTLDGTGKIEDGLRIARRLFLDLQDAGTPAATEFVDVMTAPFLSDVVTWVAIGARTAESPIHRQLASGLPCPVGFKNGTDGTLRVAVDGVAVARTGHHIISIDDMGRLSTIETRGNSTCHVILRGGDKPNHDPATVSGAIDDVRRIGAPPRLMIDCSHGNANQPGGQTAAFQSVARQVRDGNAGIMGVMLESNLVAGCQSLDPANEMVYGQSITDACLGLDETARLLRHLADQQRVIS